MSAFRLGSKAALADLSAVASGRRKVAFDAAARRRVKRAADYLDAEIAKGRVIYGVNTGFGELANRRIDLGKIRQLQRNYLRSHASGVGPPLRREEARGMLFLRANEFARGRSGVRPKVVAAMAKLLNAGVAPVVPSRGSVGASGDLAPQAHVALILVGLGQAWIPGKPKPVSGRAALAYAGLEPLVLERKEGLALTNGTQGMQSVGGLSLARALRLWTSANLAGAMTLEALKGTPSPFRAAVHALKPHPGQIRSARELRRHMRESEIRRSHAKDDPRVQDPYSLRCMPQVHGAVLDALHEAVRVIEIEMNSITDNPIVVPGDDVYSGGNFHGQAMSFAFDHAATALTALGNVSERRVFQLVSDTSGILPPFLANKPGLESGFMIAQYAAAALASENKRYAWPAAADSIPTSGNKEDFVSMGMGGALRLRPLLDNVERIVAIEILAASRGIEHHAPLKPGVAVAKAVRAVRKSTPRAAGDTVLSPKIEAVARLVRDGAFVEAAR